MTGAMSHRSLIRLVPVLLSILFTSGCATTVLESRAFKSYSLGETKTAAVGEAFLVDQSGTVQKVKKWVGIMNSPDGWQVTEEYSKDFLRKELLYGGKSGSTIEISYREYRGGYAAPAFFQNLKYDMKESEVIRFQNFTIQIIGADNEKITYQILRDH